VLTPVIPATQEAEIRRIVVQSQPRQIVHETPSQNQNKTNHKKGLVEWVKVKALNSNPSTEKKNPERTGDLPKATQQGPVIAEWMNEQTSSGGLWPCWQLPWPALCPPPQLLSWGDRGADSSPWP
jgi:hypothetical protein